jgi:hypothetical protein
MLITDGDLMENTKANHRKASDKLQHPEADGNELANAWHDD